jgi:hypothetical protein
MNLQNKIQHSISELNHSYNHLNGAQLNYKPTEKDWSVLECLEHIFLINERVLKALSSPYPPSNGNIENTKTELFSFEKLNHILVTKREANKLDAPDFSVPTGAFSSKENAVQNIQRNTEGILNFLDSNDITQDTQTIAHIRLGEMTKTDWIHFMVTHTFRHLKQIEALKAHAHFPA